MELGREVEAEYAPVLVTALDSVVNVGTGVVTLLPVLVSVDEAVDLEVEARPVKFDGHAIVVPSLLYSP